MKMEIGVVTAMLVLGAMVIHPVAAETNSVAEHFKKLDVDSDGFITLQEAEKTDDLDEEALNEGDMNDDGQLDLAEFEKLEITDE